MKYFLPFVIALAALGQDDKKPYPGVDQQKVDAAIEKGAAWLLKQNYEDWQYHDWGKMRHDELVLYTLLHAGTDRENELFKKLLAGILEKKLERTYCVSLHAMLLLELDAVKYQARIAQCCQFLVDNQSPNGQWSYGKETTYDKDVATGGSKPRDDVATGGGEASKPKKPKKPERAIHIKRRQKAPYESGDNSNSQYAALGLRACMEANVWPPFETLKLAKKWWEDQQNADGGWTYGGKGGDAYGSMSAGAIGSLIIYKHYLREDWKADGGVGKGVKWVIDNFTVKENPKTKEGFIWCYYYLYALERLGILSGLDKFGANDWYRVGANELLRVQKDDGSWYEGNTYGGSLKDTCFAILFLRRATIPLPKVATGK